MFFPPLPTASRSASPAASYLRGYPCDHLEMLGLLYAVETYAGTFGHACTRLFHDCGIPSRGRKPGLDALLAEARTGAITRVFVPALWVFSIDDLQARSVRDDLLDHGCEVLTLLRRQDRQQRRTG
ncbi:hypothetical protein ACPCAC_06820 [Streptomyces lavendulocolor]|uniref:hypothetical protein n=1 Tax=Streptomyces lavendulocolor TaxID=67316 RepID=UPI003C2BEA39